MRREEGVAWLGKVLRHLASIKDIELTTASEFVQRHPPQEVLNVPESSWGSNGTHFTWDNIETHWMWQPIHEAEARMENLVARFPMQMRIQRTVLTRLGASCYYCKVPTGRS